MPSSKSAVHAISLMLILVLSSCATPTRPVRHPAPLLPGMTANEDPQPKTPEITVSDQDLKEFEEPEVVAAPPEDDEDEEDIEIRPKKDRVKNSPIPHQFNEKVATWIRYFSQKDRERFQAFLDRGEPYREAVENILEENKVPVDLYYLGLIESGFNFRAKSRVKAVGVWQFMKPTGRMYGLEVDPYIDERRDPIRATEAAAKYLRDLYREFDSWYLAMAAYNAGPGRIRGSIRRAGTKDFWELVERRKLPSETMEYIPKFLAARYIGENPELFAFYINEEKKYPNVELLKVPSPVTFDSIEKASGMPNGTLSFVNPHYLKNHTHPGRRMDEIWVPENYLSTVSRSLGAIASQKIRVKPEPVVYASASKRKKTALYIVKKGDTLKSIAAKKGLSVAYLREMNGLGKKAKIIPGQTLKLSATSYRQKRSHPRKAIGRKRRQEKG